MTFTQQETSTVKNLFDSNSIKRTNAMHLDSLLIRKIFNWDMEMVYSHKTLKYAHIYHESLRWNKWHSISQTHHVFDKNEKKQDSIPPLKEAIPQIQ